jgi:polyhydroxybutyrate depolymerase
MPSLNSEVQHATMRVGDRERSYLAYVAAMLPSGAALVIALHGSGMDGAKMRAWTGYEFDHMADQRKLSGNHCRRIFTVRHWRRLER